MSYKRRYMKERYVTRKLRRDVYSRLEALCGGLGLNECLEDILSRVERCRELISTVDIRPASTVDIKPISTVDVNLISAVDMKQPQPRPHKVRVEMLSHPWGFWRVIVGEGYDSIVFTLPRIALEGMCERKLLHTDICEALHNAIARATSSAV